MGHVAREVERRRSRAGLVEVDDRHGAVQLEHLVRVKVTVRGNELGVGDRELELAKQPLEPVLELRNDRSRAARGRCRCIELAFRREPPQSATLSLVHCGKRHAGRPSSGVVFLRRVCEQRLARQPQRWEDGLPWGNDLRDPMPGVQPDDRARSRRSPRRP
jgi:hypothetical protein